MKLKQLLSKKEKRLVLNGIGYDVGIVPWLCSEADEYYTDDIANAIASGVYILNGNRETSCIYNQLFDWYKEDLPTATLEDLISCANCSMGNHIHSKYATKWTKIYKAIYSEYDLLTDNSYTETKQYKDDKTDNGKETTSNNSNSNATETTKESSETTTERENFVSADVYGFNSESSVHDTEDLTRDVEKVTQEADKNVTSNDSSSTTNNNGTKDNTFTSNAKGEETLNRKGLNTSASTVLTKELKYRLTYNFVDIVVSDIINLFSNLIY